MTIGRLSQAAVEAVLQAAPKVRLCQQAGELLLQGTPRARLGQQAVEVLRSVAISSTANARPPVMLLWISG